MSTSGIKHFRWLSTRSAWQDIEYHRQLRAESLKTEQATMDQINLAMANAQQNKITVASNNAARAALKRVQAAVKAKSDANVHQIDAAKKSVASAETAIASTADTTSAPAVDTTA